MSDLKVRPPMSAGHDPDGARDKFRPDLLKNECTGLKTRHYRKPGARYAGHGFRGYTQNCFFRR
jgi:hypothetical protein